MDALTDITGTRWIINRFLGFGGFGTVYNAIPFDSSSATSSSKRPKEVIVKIERLENRTIVLEILVYDEIYDESRIEEWKNYKRLQHLGIPKYYGCGTTKYENKYYRFIVLEKIMIDTGKLLKKKRRIKPKLVKIIVHDILYALEYIHKYGISHCDVKPDNIMLDINNRAYLIDYGMVSRFVINGFHVRYPKERKTWYKGTTYYASLDAHNGIRVSRRGDLESLGYCMMKWVKGSLPWNSFYGNNDLTYAAKCDFIKQLHEGKLGYKAKNRYIYMYIKTVTLLSYEEKPNYNVLHQIVGI